jgi:UrcA family protein
MARKPSTGGVSIKKRGVPHIAAKERENQTGGVWKSNQTESFQMYMQPGKNQRAGLIATLLVAGAGFGLAQESPATEVRRERVSFAGLDLSTASGEREFERRVRLAIRRVCEAPRGVAAHGSQRELVECRQRAMKDVRRQLQARGIKDSNLITRN